MTSGLLILVAAFAIAVLGFFVSNLAKAQDRGLFGLSRFGTAMLSLSIVGLAAGVWKEVADARESTLAKAQSTKLQKQLEDNSEDLKLIKAGLDGLAGQHGLSPALAQDLRVLADKVSAVASSARYGDFRMTDFSRSHFGNGNFTEASFENALIDTAQLKGAVITNSNLDGVDFAGSRFVGAKFFNAILEGADFRGADLTRAHVDSTTRFPK